MKPFDLQKALGGDPVVTRDGDPVTQLVQFEGIRTSRCSLRGVIKDCIQAFDAEGRFSGLQHGSRYDLFMAPKKRTLYLNVWKSSGGIYLPSLSPDPNFAATTASEHKKNSPGVVYQHIALPIEVEE